LGAPACPIVIDVEIDPGAQEGAVVHHVEACGGGAAACATDDDQTPVLIPTPFGAEFGIAPINGPDSQTVPALPGETHAYWAGTCDRASAPAIGDDMADDGGIGTRPANILAPNGPEFFNRTSIAAPPLPPHCIEWESPGDFPSPVSSIWFQAPGWRLPPVNQAGAHPDGTAMMAFNRSRDGVGTSSQGDVDGSVDNIYVDLPADLVADPNATAKCSGAQFAVKPLQCPPESQVGVLHLWIRAAPLAGTNLGNTNEWLHPVYNLEPREGNVAELGFGYASGEGVVTVRIVAKARTNGDFGVTTFVGQIPVALPVVGQAITIWGVPWEATNDLWRDPDGVKVTPQVCAAQPAGLPAQRYYIPPAGFTDTAGCRAPYDPSWGPIKPFVLNITECSGEELQTPMMTDSYQFPGAFTADHDPDPSDGDWRRYVSKAPPVTGCEKVPFDANIDMATSSSAADAPTGLSVDLNIPQNDDLPFPAPEPGADQGEVDDYVQAATDHWKSDAGLSTGRLDKAVVTLPKGVSVNPSGAAGLDGCSDSEIGLRQQGNPPLFNNRDPFDGDASDGVECPDASKIGTVRVETPLLDEPLHGVVVLGDPKSTDPQSGQMFRLFLVLENEQRGLLAKVYGSAVADPVTGQLTATFDKNPRVPFEDMHLDFKSGDRAQLALPQRCGSTGWLASFTPWAAAHNAGGPTDPDNTGTFAVDNRCQNAFSPAFSAGMDTQTARANGSFSFRFSRSDGEQYLRNLTATLPPGLLASVKDVPLCSNAAANAGSCPAGSKIGIVDAKAGSGDPFVLEQKGEVFLTDGYKGGAYGLAVKIRPIAGPFRGAMELSPIVVRQAIHVDRTTAQVTAISDPFPLIHHGVPLRAREVTVLVNRGGFMLNPSDCAAKQVGAAIGSDQGATSNQANGFQATNCAALAFKPKLALTLTGRKQTRTGKHPGVKAKVTQTGIPEAGIERAEVRLPKSLALDPDNAQALCEYEAGIKPDLENHCPKGSIVGRARAISPLLNDPLVGNVYFVKNVRRSSSGNVIRTLPMIIVALRGEIAVNLKGESSTTKSGKLVNTFAAVPDAPITQFNLNIRGGKTGILAITRTRRSRINLCTAGRQTAEADIDGHNGRRHDTDIRIKTPCRKSTKSKKAKRSSGKGRTGGKSQRRR
jgi:hypothetical protein